jgi:putative membrane protein
MLILTLIILGFLIFFAIKYYRDGSVEIFQKENPLEILKLRYARGEITREVFEEMKRELS